MHRGYLKAAVLLGALSVLLGAFAAHGLRKLAEAQVVTVFETGVRYQFYHVFALALTGILYKEYPNKWVQWSGILFILGILFFCGSLYLLTYKSITFANGMFWVGPLTPMGGLFFIAGWISLACGISDNRTS
jgi:uncharacterized membrane protein YgdD (TMEM256/DUF423 family)